MEGTDVDLGEIHKIRLGCGKSSGLLLSDSDEEEKIKFPKFIPDDPEYPHLSSWKKEKARRAIIAEYI